MEKLKAQWEALPQWQKYVILIFLPIAVIAYIYLMFLSPLQEELEKAKKEKDQIYSEIEQLKRLTDPRSLDSLKRQKEQLQVQLSQKKQELEKVVGEIPSEKDTGTVYRRLGLIAKKNGVVILSANLGKPVEIGYDIEKVEEGKRIVKIAKDQGQTYVKYPTAELKLSFIGSYSQIVSFLKDLGEEGFVSYPSSLRISKFEGEKLKGDITLFVLMKEESL